MLTPVKIISAIILSTHIVNAYQTIRTPPKTVSARSTPDASVDIASSDIASYSPTISTIIPDAANKQPTSALAHEENPISTEHQAEDECEDTNSTNSILPVASTINKIAQNSCNLPNSSDHTENGFCDSAGGGCYNYIESFKFCEDDQCFCSLSYQAQLCAQCISTQDIIHEYNLYIAACFINGYIKPTQTLTVECQDTSQTYDVLTDMLAKELETATLKATRTRTRIATATVTQNPSDTNTDEEGETGDSMGKVALRIPNNEGNSSNGSNISGTVNELPSGIITVTTTDQDGQPTSVITYIGPTAQPSYEATSPTDPSTIVQPGSGENASSTAALDSAHTFFSSTADPTCENDCQDWLYLAETCTNDSCICTTDTMASAKACSSCVLSSNSNVQMNAYNGFQQGCIDVSATSNAAATDDPSSGENLSSREARPTPTQTLSGSPSNDPDEDDSSATRAVKTRVAEQAMGIQTIMADDPAKSDWAIRTTHSCLGGFGGISWTVFGLLSGMLITIL
ncbi:uncharacterized protein L201_002116 [Kwoniella dendrophila CBS 6074]|uniref:Extracellular membrane protein CFEM domain-containing protein n=1 Tax=Kwoniella dendrophila CBS 6074 TaxID=1295534 RepID=A0AAX4JQT1_9TREE